MSEIRPRFEQLIDHAKAAIQSEIEQLDTQYGNIDDRINEATLALSEYVQLSEVASIFQEHIPDYARQLDQERRDLTRNLTEAQSRVQRLTSTRSDVLKKRTRLTNEIAALESFVNKSEKTE